MNTNQTARLLTSFMLVFIAVSSAVIVDAQTRTPMMSFESTAYDFGKIREADGLVSYKFIFTNTGAIPLIINQVTSTCGCTAPSWSKEPVLPGAKGFIAVTYDPRDRPGIFEKTITVNTNAVPAVVLLKISGDVIPISNPLEQQFKVGSGGLKMKTNQLPFGDVYLNSSKTVESPVYNAGKAAIQLSYSNVPDYMEIASNPEVINPGEMAMISVTLHIPQKDFWGEIRNRINILVNGKVLQGNHITIVANVTEDFSNYSQKDLAEAPVISFESVEYNFGKAKEGAVISYEFNYVNKGKRNLIIHGTTATCGCTLAQSNVTTIEPGKRGKISVNFDTGGRSGEQNKTITVASNDPKNPRAVLRIKGVVTK